jgi:hypothetical protein
MMYATTIAASGDVFSLPDVAGNLRQMILEQTWLNINVTQKALSLQLEMMTISEGESLDSLEQSPLQHHSHAEDLENEDPQNRRKRIRGAQVEEPISIISDHSIHCFQTLWEHHNRLPSFELLEEMPIDKENPDCDDEIIFSSSSEMEAIPFYQEEDPLSCPQQSSESDEESSSFDMESNLIKFNSDSSFDPMLLRMHK